MSLAQYAPNEEARKKFEQGMATGDVNQQIAFFGEAIKNWIISMPKLIMRGGMLITIKAFSTWH